MQHSIDAQTDYSSKELYTYLSGHPLPEYVKEAGLSSVFVGDIEKTAFADEMGRYFPINSKANVYISNAFLVNKKAALAELKGNLYVAKVEDKITKAASALGMQVDIALYNAFANEKMAEDYTDRTISVDLDGDTVDLFSIKTAEQLADSAYNFSKELDRFPFAWRRPISEQFIKAAEELGVEELPDIILKYAGQFYPDVHNISAELQRRATKLTSTEDKENYAKLAEAASDIETKEDIFKIAEICYATEKAAGLYDQPYNKKVLGDPVNRLFTLSFEKVAELLDTVTMAGERFATQDLSKISTDIYEKAFGFEIDPKTAEAKDVLATMPKADVELFKQLSGIKPL